MKLLQYDYSGAFIEGGIKQEDLQGLAPRLEQIRQEVDQEDTRLWSEGNIPAEKQPLDAAFYQLPEKLLADYRNDPQTS